MATEIITAEDFVGYTPLSCGSNGKLDGNYIELLDYIAWVINYREIDENRKGSRFAEAIATLKSRYGTEVSTQFLQQFCKNRKQKSAQVMHLLDISGYKTYPIKRKYKSHWKSCGRSTLSDVFDMLMPTAEWKFKEMRIRNLNQNWHLGDYSGVVAMANLFDN